VCPGRETTTHYFSCLGGPGADSTKIVSGHVTLNLCFYIWWDLWVMLCILVCTGHEASTHYFSCSAGPSAVYIKVHRDTLRRTCALHLVGSVGHIVHSGASGPRNIGTLFFMLGWPWCGFHKRAGTRYVELVFLHPVGSVGHVAHSRSSGARNVEALFFMLGWA
jgi:hypothetical protein